MNEIKESKNEIIVERNETLIEENTNLIEKSSNYNVLVAEFNKLLLDNHHDRISAFTYLENNFSKLYEESFSSELESFLISIFNSCSKQEKDDWIYLNAVINSLTLILKKVKSKKSFTKISSLIIDNIENLVKHNDFRVRQNLPELLMILLFEINENPELFNLSLKVLLDDVCRNLEPQEIVKNELKGISLFI